ncbi:MAG: 6-pyruvoyl tetrahydrobiopterin synthase [Bacteroidetes bacterium]|nr:MAG: 6-pyruvoyl tetrahydrobiopterin synthase [Bacteroidota bacterium]PIE87700.1 MAG: 6-pyruvoyl tetrahydrobiopterin synthase [Bacteroidota bacterium]
MVYLTRRERFNAAHRLFRPEWTDEENLRVFGKCSNPHWHGHNYVLFVTVKGSVNPLTGFLVNLKELSKVIRAYVIEPMDHKNLNVEVPFLTGKIISSEAIVVAIWKQLEAPIARMGVTLHRIRLEETENNFVEYFGA